MRSQQGRFPAARGIEFRVAVGLAATLAAVAAASLLMSRSTVARAEAPPDPAAGPPADLILVGGRIYTLDAQRPAIGDQAVRIVLDVYERVLGEAGRIGSDHRWRVIHAQVVHPDDFVRFGRLHLVAEVNPYHLADDMRWMEERIGHDRSRGAYAFRRLKDAGAVLIFGSDSPGTNAARYYLNPVYGLYAAVTRQTLKGEPAGGWFPDQRLTIEEAIDAATRAPAWASFEEDRKGVLRPGMLADVAVLDTNLVEAGHANPAALLKAQVHYTIAGGRVVFERRAADNKPAR